MKEENKFYLMSENIINCLSFNTCEYARMFVFACLAPLILLMWNNGWNEWNVVVVVLMWAWNVADMFIFLKYKFKVFKLVKERTLLGSVHREGEAVIIVRADGHKINLGASSFTKEQQAE